jgi:hypothetical protein
MVQKDSNISQTNEEVVIYTICVLFLLDAIWIIV